MLSVSAMLMLQTRATLPYSQLAYVEPCLNMNEQTWIGYNIHMFEYFGGVTLRIVCDNLKTGVVTHPREGAIILNQCYEDFSNHYCTDTITLQQSAAER